MSHHLKEKESKEYSFLKKAKVFEIRRKKELPCYAVTTYKTNQNIVIMENGKEVVIYISFSVIMSSLFAIQKAAQF